MIDRRKFITLLGSGTLGMLLNGCGGGGGGSSSETSTGTGGTGAVSPTVPVSGVSGRVVVVGGGMAGATAAKFLRLWGGSGLDVTLIERDRQYQSNILSNLVLTGQRSMASLAYTHDKLSSAYGVKVVYGNVAEIDPAGKRVHLADNSSLPYDRLVLAPGIAFDTLPGLETAGDRIVHAWQAGPQTVTLQQQIAAMNAGGVFVLTIPKTPYRCPPGPYERACVVADYLKTRKAGSKVIVLDANASIAAEPVTFDTAFNFTHAGVIEYHSGVTINSIDPSTQTLDTSAGLIRGDVLNPIPPQRAGAIVSNTAGLANVNGRWAGVDVRSYESTALAGIHIIGDANGSTQPKAGHIANAEAKVCADAIVRILAGGSPDPSPVTNSACYSPITASTASWLTVVFGYDSATGTMKAMPGAAGEASSATRDNYDDMFVWFNNLMGDTFA